MNGEKTAALYGVGQAPSPGVTVALALQHVLILFGGIELVPVMLSKIYQVTPEEIHRVTFATAVTAAVSTLLQLRRFGHFGLGYTMFIGTSGAFMSCAHSAIQMGGFALFAFMGLLCAPFQVLYSYFFRYLKNIITPVVGGVIIMLCMAGMLKDAVIVWTGTGNTPLMAQQKLLVGAVTITALICAEWYGGRKWRPWAMAFGLIAGCLAAWPFGMLDFSRVMSASWFGLPGLNAPEFHFEFTPEYLSLFITFVIAALVTSVKYTGDAMALQQVSNTRRSKVDYDALQGGLYADAFGTVLSSLAGGMPTTSHSPNISLIQVTGTASRRIGVAGACLMILMAMCPKAMLLMVSLPEPVLGAVAVTLTAHLFSTGMMLASSDGLSFKKGLIVGFPLCAGIALESNLFLTNAFPAYIEPLTSNGFAVGGVVAVFMSAMSRFMPGRMGSFKVDLSDESLAKLHEWLATKAVRFGLDERRQYQLELSCEEVFMHMREEFKRSGYAGPVTFKLFHDESRLVVEVVGGSKVSELDEVTERPSPDEAGMDDLARLGLYLLSKTAQNITHVHISGYAFVNFSIPVK